LTIGTAACEKGAAANNHNPSINTM
jgi:hypothetical protein